MVIERSIHSNAHFYIKPAAETWVNVCLFVALSCILFSLFASFFPSTSECRNARRKNNSRTQKKMQRKTTEKIKFSFCFLGAVGFFLVSLGFFPWFIVTVSFVYMNVLTVNITFRFCSVCRQWLSQRVLGCSQPAIFGNICAASHTQIHVAYVSCSRQKRIIIVCSWVSVWDTQKCVHISFQLCIELLLLLLLLLVSFYSAAVPIIIVGCVRISLWW